MRLYVCTYATPMNGSKGGEVEEHLVVLPLPDIWRTLLRASGRSERDHGQLRYTKPQPTQSQAFRGVVEAAEAALRGLGLAQGTKVGEKRNSCGRLPGSLSHRK